MKVTALNDAIERVATRMVTRHPIATAAFVMSLFILGLIMKC